MNLILIVSLLICLLAIICLIVILKRARNDAVEGEEKVLFNILKNAFTSMDEFLQYSIKAIVAFEHLGFAKKGAIFLLDNYQQTQQLQLASACNLNAAFTALNRSIALDHSLCQRAVDARVINFTLLNEDQKRGVYQDLGANAYYSVPVIHHGRLLALLLIFVEADHKKNDQTLIFLQRTAEVLALGITRNQIELHMNRQIYYDQLTNLPNRYLLMDRLNQALFVARRHQVQYAILYVVIDRWQQLLDDYGQAEVDQLIKQIGHKFTAVLREEDTVASLGDSEFGILISNIGSEKVATTTEIGYVVDKLTNVFEQVFVVAEQSLLLSMSIGVAMIPDDGEDVSTILKNAEKSAKSLHQQGGDGFAFYAEKLQRQSDSRKKTIEQLKQALESDQMQVYYQAMVNEDSQIFGVEALLYWQHPELGLVGPEQFIPMAEECGLIKQIGTWVLNNACQQFIEFRQADSSGQLSYLAINISSQQFYAPGFYKLVEQAIQQANMASEQLVLEITEGLMQQDIERTNETLLQLSALGILIAIDDFGTGYSSLVSLEQLPLRQLKIDQSFVDNIGELAAGKIVETIISVARHLEIEVIAKGVETTDQYRQLQQLGCNKYQGFLFNKPMTAADFSQLLAQEKRDFSVH